jgi:hypothetical protein
MLTADVTESFQSLYIFQFVFYAGYFTSDNEPGGIENATHNTFAKLTWIFVFDLKNIAVQFRKF